MARRTVCDMVRALPGPESPLLCAMCIPRAAPRMFSTDCSDSKTVHRVQAWLLLIGRTGFVASIPNHARALATPRQAPMRKPARHM
jgi:hypothetical protein